MTHHTSLLGAHLSIAGGFDKAIERGQSIGCTAIQIFTKNNKSYKGKPIPSEAEEAFKQSVKASSIKWVVSHASYLINAGASDQTIAQRSTEGLIHELERCEQLGIPYLVIHPGSHTGAGEQVCIERIAENIDHVLKAVDGTSMILLETAAGQGTNVGYTFQHLAQIRSLCKEKKRVGICFDTCHIFSAGYDITTTEGYKETWNLFDTIIGRAHLKVIHLNDSMMPCASRKDRHENIGKGKIPLTTFSMIMNDPSLADIPKILETPSDDGITEYREEIKLLREMIKK
jgi:deoxyribonuclease-4